MTSATDPGVWNVTEAELVRRSYGQVTAALDDLPASELARPTRAAGWTVADLAFHLLLDAQRVLVTLASPTDAPADVDRVTYWRPFRPGADAGGEAAHAAYVRRSAAAFASESGVVPHWSDTAAAAVRAAARAPVDGRVTTQGHVLTVPDFLSTIVVEATVHYLDLTVELAATPVDAEALSHTIEVLDLIAGEPLDRSSDPVQLVLEATGRLPSPDRRFPLLG